MALNISIQSANIVFKIMGNGATLKDLSDKKEMERTLDLLQKREIELRMTLQDTATVDQYEKAVRELKDYIQTL